MKVSIYTLENGVDTCVGTIISRGGQLFLSPDCELLQNICGDSIMGENGERIEPDDADRFVANLPYQYKSAYLRAVAE